MRRLPWKNNLFIFAVTLIAAINMKYCLNVERESLAYTNSILSFFLWIGWSIALRKIVGGEHWQRISDILNYAYGFALCFTGSMIAGARLDNQKAVDFGDWHMYVAALSISLAAAPIFAWAVQWLGAYCRKERRQVRNGGERWRTEERKRFFLVWGIFVVAYIPVFLASYPGFFSYDALVETNMVFTETYSAHHPPFHVLLLGGIIRVIYKLTKSYNAGIAVYIFAQMLFLSGCFSYVVCFLGHIGVKKWICNISIVFLALFPTVSMFVCCSTKDGIFSAGVLLFCTLLLEMARDVDWFWKQRSRKLGMIFSILLILLFRNNGIYAFAVFLIPFALIYKKWWRKWIPSMAVSLLIFGVITGGLTAVFHFEKGETAEMLCVPMQQLARVYTEEKGSFTNDELDTLYRLIPQDILKNYRPKLADDVKVGFDEEAFRESFSEYVSLWVEKGLQHPDIYVNSFLANTYGFWYPDTVLDAYRGRKMTELIYEDSSYFAFDTERPGIRMHLLPALERFYQKISLEIYQQRLPVISMFFSIGFWNWLYMFLIFYLLTTERKRQACAMGIMGVLYLTVLLGPVALVRYVLYFFFACPLFLAMLFDAEMVGGGRVEKFRKLGESDEKTDRKKDRGSYSVPENIV